MDSWYAEFVGKENGLRPCRGVYDNHYENRMSPEKPRYVIRVTRDQDTQLPILKGCQCNASCRDQASNLGLGRGAAGTLSARRCCHSFGTSINPLCGNFTRKKALLFLSMVAGVLIFPFVVWCRCSHYRPFMHTLEAGITNAPFPHPTQTSLSDSLARRHCCRRTPDRDSGRVCSPTLAHFIRLSMLS